MRWCAQSQQSTSLLGLRETGCLQHLLRKKDTERADGEEHGQASRSLPFITLHGHMKKGEKFPKKGNVLKAHRSLSKLLLPFGGV